MRLTICQEVRLGDHDRNAFRVNVIVKVKEGALGWIGSQEHEQRGMNEGASRFNLQLRCLLMGPLQVEYSLRLETRSTSIE